MTPLGNVKIKRGIGWHDGPLWMFTQSSIFKCCFFFLHAYANNKTTADIIWERTWHICSLQSLCNKPLWRWNTYTNQSL